MTINKTIFALRFGSNDELFPTREELLDQVREFALQFRQNASSADLRPRMFYNVIDHTHFAHPSLKLAVEQYQYHSHALRTLDIRKPSAFIRSAEEELKKLSTNKKEDAVKAARLQGMVDERKKTLEEIRKKRAALTAELAHIARYIGDNLRKIKVLCEASADLSQSRHC